MIPTNHHFWPEKKKLQLDVTAMQLLFTTKEGNTCSHTCTGMEMSSRHMT